MCESIGEAARDETPGKEQNAREHAGNDDERQRRAAVEERPTEQHAEHDHDDPDRAAGRRVERPPPGPGDEPSCSQSDEERCGDADHLAHGRSLVVVAPADRDEHDDDGDVEGGGDPDRRAGHVIPHFIVLRPSSFGGETAEGALEEQQRVGTVAVVVCIRLEGDDAAEDEVVVTHLVHALGLAVDPRHRPVDDR